MSFDTHALRALGWCEPPSTTALAEREVQLWLIKVPDTTAGIDALLARLSPAERDRAAAKRVVAKRHEYITGQASLRTLLGKQLAVDPMHISYRRGVKGKPYLSEALGDEAQRVQFNITHSGDMVMVAMALDAELGVDVEWLNERTDPQRVARRAFSDGERAALAAIDEEQQRTHFFQLWTCKEALVKCTGLGIHSGMSHYEIVLGSTPEGDNSAHVKKAWGKQANVARLHVLPLRLGLNEHASHAGALVHEPPALKPRFWILDRLPDPLSEIWVGLGQPAYSAERYTYLWNFWTELLELLDRRSYWTNYCDYWDYWTGKITVAEFLAGQVFDSLESIAAPKDKD